MPTSRAPPSRSGGTGCRERHGRPRGGAAGVAGAMEGYEHLCRVRGTVRAGDEALTVDCLGQRGHAWGAPDWERMELTRTLGAWFGEDLAVVLSAVRPARAREHEAEAL